MVRGAPAADGRGRRHDDDEQHVSQFPAAIERARGGAGPDRQPLHAGHARRSAARRAVDGTVDRDVRRARCLAGERDPRNRGATRDRSLLGALGCAFSRRLALRIDAGQLRAHD